MAALLRRGRNRLFIAGIITGLLSIRDNIYGPTVFAGLRTNDFIAIARPEGIYGKGRVISAAKTLPAGAGRLIYGRAAPVIA